MNTTAKLHYFHHPNIGNVDKLVRYFVGGVLIGSILIVAPTQVGWMALLPLMAIPIVISAIIGWDPIYALFQKQPTFSLLPLDTKLAAESNPRETTSYQVEREAA
jgi:Inner membrane protein YgaP-like, transmembrane domain